MARKELTVSLYMSELIYDVQNKTYLTGRSRQAEGNYEEVAHMQANDDEENKNQIARSLGNAFQTLKSKLSDYIVEQGTTANNILMDVSPQTKLSLAFSMPSNYNEATREAIATSIHKYIINTAVGDWFTITNKADAADYIAQASLNINEIREAINKRVRPTRPDVVI